MITLDQVSPTYASDNKVISKLSGYNTLSQS